MKRRILVAGLGNVFFGDDGFGVAVARRLERESIPGWARVADFGIRSVHLAFELLDPPDLLVMVDAVTRDGAPGTLYVIDPEDDASGGGVVVSDPHGMHPAAVLAAVRQMGGAVPRTRVVGCEPLDLAEKVGLSEPVAAAITPAIEMIRQMLQAEHPR